MHQDTEFSQDTMNYMADGWHLPIWKQERRTEHYGWARFRLRQLMLELKRSGKAALQRLGGR